MIPEGTPAGQNPTPYVGEPVFAPPTFNPTNGSKVGAAKPIYINFARPIADRAMAEQAIHISSIPPVPGRFYWTSDTQVRWRPQDFWPAGTVVNIDASGTKSSFTVPEQLVATIDDATHQMQVVRNGKLEKTIPVSMGMAAGGHQTPNGTYYVLEKFPDIVMDSSTYGVPVNSAQGYKVHVQLAVRIDNSGNFVHSAPWSVGDQGIRNVSHGCINISPDNAKWFYDNFGSGDPVVVKNSERHLQPARRRVGLADVLALFAPKPTFGRESASRTRHFVDLAAVRQGASPAGAVVCRTTSLGSSRTSNRSCRFSSSRSTTARTARSACCPGSWLTVVRSMCASRANVLSS